MMNDFLKTRPGAPEGFFAAEAAGLRWLAEPSAVPAVEVLETGAEFLRLARVEPAPPSAAGAQEFGRGLARLHEAGAPGFGWVPAASAWFGPLADPFPGPTTSPHEHATILVTDPPSAAGAQEFGRGVARLHEAGAPVLGWAPAETDWFGPLDDPFPVPTTSHNDHATFLARDRLSPLAQRSRDQLDRAGADAVDAAIEVIGAGAFDGISGQGREAPARVHGDLWSGNLMWTASGGTLIDPAAHGGHRLEDLAMLSLFGAPYLEEIFAGYEAEHPLPAGWREDLPAHLFFGLPAHVALFGGGYAQQTVTVARRITARAQQLEERRA